MVVNARLSEREVDEIHAHCRPRLALFTHGASPDALRHGVRYRALEGVLPGLGPLMAGALDTASPREPKRSRARSPRCSIPPAPPGSRKG